MNHRGNAEAGVFNEMTLNLIDYFHLLARIVCDRSIGTSELTDTELQGGFHRIWQVIIGWDCFANGDGLIAMNLKPDRYKLSDFFFQTHFFQQCCSLFAVDAHM